MSEDNGHNHPTPEELAEALLEKARAERVEKGQTYDGTDIVAEMVIRPEESWSRGETVEKATELLADLIAMGNDRWGFVVYLTADDIADDEDDDEALS